MCTPWTYPITGQVGHGWGHFLRNGDTYARTLVLYIELFIYDYWTYTRTVQELTEQSFELLKWLSIICLVHCTASILLASVMSCTHTSYDPVPASLLSSISLKFQFQIYMPQSFLKVPKTMFSRLSTSRISLKPFNLFMQFFVLFLNFYYFFHLFFIDTVHFNSATGVM